MACHSIERGNTQMFMYIYSFLVAQLETLRMNSVLSCGRYRVINTLWPRFIIVAVQILTANNELLALWRHKQRSHVVNKIVAIPKAYYHSLFCNICRPPASPGIFLHPAKGLNLQQLFPQPLFSDLQTSPASSLNVMDKVELLRLF